jgi:hypothetical protein
MAHDDQVVKELSSEEEEERVQRLLHTRKLMESEKLKQEQEAREKTEKENLREIKGDEQFEFPFKNMR